MPTARDPGRADQAHELVTAHLPLVGFLVSEVAPRLPRRVSREDVHSAALVGLVQAAAAFDPGYGVPFRRYATTRIRSSIMDELRSDASGASGGRPDATRGSAQVAVGSTAEQVASALGRAPTTAELAQALGCTLAEAEQAGTVLRAAAAVDIDALLAPDLVLVPAGTAPPGPADESDFALGAAVDGLPSHLRSVVRMYFEEGQSLPDIATTLGVPETRVAELRAEAVSRLRESIDAQRTAGRAERPDPMGLRSERGRGPYPGGTAGTPAAVETRTA